AIHRADANLGARDRHQCRQERALAFRAKTPPSHESNWKGSTMSLQNCAPCLAVVLLAVSKAAAITIPTVLVGNPGNAPDPAVNVTNDTSGDGSVSYIYGIGTTEVTNAQYAAFLNAKALSDPLALYNPSMGTNARGGITRSGSDGSYTYGVKSDMGNK